jgi:hypothetical protein
MTFDNAPARSLLLMLLLGLGGCSGQDDTPQAGPTEEPWSNQAELVFQRAEVLKYSLTQHQLEQQRLRALGIEGATPVPGYQQPQRR